MNVGWSKKKVVERSCKVSEGVTVCGVWAAENGDNKVNQNATKILQEAGFQ